MNKSINLLPRKGRQGAGVEKALAILQRISFIALLAVVFMSLTLFALNYNGALPDLKRQENASLTNLSLLHGKSAKVLLLKDRLSAIGNVLNHRTSYQALLDQVAKIIPGDASLESISLNKTELSLVVSARSLSGLSNLLDTMSDMVNSKETFKSLSVDGISADSQSQKYTLLLRAQFL